jgi:lipopolysaccharide transport system permease protein
MLGAAWAILQPLSMMVIFTIVFSLFLQVSTDGVPYPVFVYTTLLPWTFCATSLTFGVPSLVTNAQLLTKIYFPREILPFASIGAALVDLLVASSLLVPLLIWYQTPLTWSLLWVPFLIVLQTALIVGIVLPTAALNVFYRDVRFIVPLAVQLWLYITPVLYPLNAVPERLRPWYALNPLVGIMDAFRQVILYGRPPDPVYLGMSAVVTLVLLVSGYAFFKRAEDQFADVV